MSAFELSGLDNILAAIPAVLTFVPAETFILVVIVADPQGRRTHDVVKRADLTTFTEMPSSTALYMTRTLADRPVADLIAVVTTTAPSDDLPLRAEVDAFAETLADRGFPNLETLYLPSFDAGAQWTCYRHGDHTGELPDPSISPLAVADLVEGKSIMASREELTRRFTPPLAEDRERLILATLSLALHPTTFATMLDGASQEARTNLGIPAKPAES